MALPLAQDAAGASSLMRAKALHQDRTLRHFGVSGEREVPTGKINVSFFMLRGIEPAERSVEPPQTTETEAKLIESTELAKS